MLNVGERNPNGGEMRMALCQETFEDKQHKRPSSRVSPRSAPQQPWDGGSAPFTPGGAHEG